MELFRYTKDQISRLNMFVTNYCNTFRNNVPANRNAVQRGTCVYMYRVFAEASGSEYLLTFN